ncbi:MAG TPA: DUF3048 domain-containing protein [Acidimicrobiia bacterium]|nr:DUF3048 domain-containing protein [Acidimicrobiia bacterium]
MTVPPPQSPPEHPPSPQPVTGGVPSSRWKRFLGWLRTPTACYAGLAGAGGLLLGLLIGFYAGGDDEPASVVASTTVTTLSPIITDEGLAATTTTSGAVTETTQPALDRNPLTGEPLPQPTSRRIVAVKVDNVPAAQPQIGIGEAEMIIEVPVEGGITRFTALYFDAAPSVVGPVRSVRPVDADLLAPFRPVLLTTGGQSFVLRLFEAADIPVVPLEADGAYGVIDRPQPHHIVVLLDFIERFAGDETSPPGPFPFTDDFAADTAATSITIPFSAVTNVVWRFEDGVWVRAQNGETSEVLRDVSGVPEPLTADTVVVLSVAERSAGYEDSAGTEVTTYDVIGFGDAKVFHDGRVVEGRWLRSAQEDPWVLVDAAGARISLPVGRVFVEVVPRHVEVGYS